MVYFTSDLHFGHKNVILMYNRPFETLDQILVAKWLQPIELKSENSCIYKGFSLFNSIPTHL
jgi:calcineurin-like phosphoesterase family protein